jgi:hypothetical protein
MNLSKSLPLILFAISYGVVVFVKGWSAGLFTISVALLALLLAELCGESIKLRKGLAYAIFFLTPLLTAIGQIGALTGFGRSDISIPWQGIAFATSGIAFQIYQSKLTFMQLFGSILQPLRLVSGPLALSFSPVKTNNIQRVKLYFGWIILGGFFYGVLAAGISPLLILKHSTESIDILIFAVLFEFYVYLNFCGISLIVLGVMNLMGIRTSLNFNAPFSARSLIGYWQRWHLSFGAVLKTLFFQPSREYFGIAVAVIAVFTASAMWHGITLNFFIWGLFHAFGWLLTYYLSRVKFKKISYWGVIKKILNVSLLIFFVVVGRLLFSEDDPQILWVKLQNLILFRWTEDAFVLNMGLDIQTWLTLSACFSVILLEIIFPRKMFQYKILRQDGVLAILLVLTLLYGSNGLGSAYGSR